MDIDMKEQDDIWLKQWKDCLEDFEEEIPVNGWERLQADLHANAPLDKVEVSKAKVIPFRSWRVVAAAAVVVLFAGAGIWFLASDKAIQVPSIDSSVAQVAYKEIPTPITTPQTVEKVSEAPKVVIPVSEGQDISMQKPELAEQVSRQSVVKPSATESTSSIKKTTQISQSIAPSPLPPTSEVKSEGTPIQVKTPVRSEAQRAVNPVYRGGKGNTSEEVSTINRRQVRISTDERLHNVTRLRGQGDVTTRSTNEVTDLDRVFNSYTAHYNELYNKTERLFDNGTGDYSTVDNAFFLVGLVKKMQNQRSAADEQLYREIASRFVELQQPNGLWKNSLLDPSSHSVDVDTESYICYALAWGLNNGLLSRKQYLDAVRHAWKSIGNCNSEPCLMAAEQVQILQNGL